MSCTSTLVLGSFILKSRNLDAGEMSVGKTKSAWVASKTSPILQIPAHVSPSTPAALGHPQRTATLAQQKLNPKHPLTGDAVSEEQLITVTSIEHLLAKHHKISPNLFRVRRLLSEQQRELDHSQNLKFLRSFSSPETVSFLRDLVAKRTKSARL